MAPSHALAFARAQRSVDRVHVGRAIEPRNSQLRGAHAVEGGRASAGWCRLSWTTGRPVGGTTIGASRLDPMAYGSMIDIVSRGILNR